MKMSDKDNETEIDITELFDYSIKLLAEQSKTPQELISVWISIGKRLGVEEIFAHLKVVVYEDDYDEQRIVGFVGSPSEEAVELLSSEYVFTEYICEKAVEAIIANEKVYH
tara:strand:- start:1293 stop:1625 length:333 start_codon:yes stop_codon:yes gene_type:complete